jgi:hypothetical protein
MEVAIFWTPTLDTAPLLSKIAMMVMQGNDYMRGTMVERAASGARLIICQSCGAMIRAKTNSKAVVLSYDLSALRSVCCRSDGDICPLLVKQIARLLMSTGDGPAEQRCGMHRLN